MSYDRQQLVDFLEEFIRDMKQDRLELEGESFSVPESGLEVEYGFKIENGQKEIEIEIKWH